MNCVQNAPEWYWPILNLVVKQRQVTTFAHIGGWLYNWKFSGLTFTWKTIFINKQVIEIHSLESYMLKTQP